MGIGADTSQRRAGDALDTASAGGAAFLFGAATRSRRSCSHLLVHHRHAGLLAARKPSTRAKPRCGRASLPEARARGRGAMLKNAASLERLSLRHPPHAERQVPQTARPSSASRASSWRRGLPSAWQPFSGSSPMASPPCSTRPTRGTRFWFLRFGGGGDALVFSNRAPPKIRERAPSPAHARRAQALPNYAAYAVIAKYVLND
jgi:hypothetical protein